MEAAPDDLEWENDEMAQRLTSVTIAIVVVSTLVVGCNDKGNSGKANSRLDTE